MDDEEVEMNRQYVSCEITDGIAVVTLNRPEALNALNEALNRELLDTLRLLQGSDAVKVLILTGNARAFAAGADIREMAAATPRSARSCCALAVQINNLLENMPIPTIAAVGGMALGGGFEMALSCDLRVGGPGTVLAFPETGLGIIPGANGCARAAALVGAAKAKELIMLSTRLGGRQAYDLGLLNWCVVSEDLEISTEGLDGGEKRAAELADAENEYRAIRAKALEIARKLAGKPRCALAAAKIVINEANNRTIDAGKSRETEEFSLLFDTHDQKEGMAAAIEKRKPVYTDN